MINHPSRLFSVGALLLGTGCYTSVDLAVRNAAPFQVSSSVETFDKHGKNISIIGLGDISPSNSLSQNFEIRNGHSFKIKGKHPNGSLIYESDSITVPGDQDPFSYSVSIVPEASFSKIKTLY